MSRRARIAAMQSNRVPLIALLKASLCALALAIVLDALWIYAPQLSTIQTFSAERHADPSPATLAFSRERPSTIKDFTTARHVVVLSGWVDMGPRWSVEYEMGKIGGDYLRQTHLDGGAEQLSLKEQVKHRFLVPPPCSPTGPWEWTKPVSSSVIRPARHGKVCRRSSMVSRSSVSSRFRRIHSAGLFAPVSDSATPTVEPGGTKDGAELRPGDSRRAVPLSKTGGGHV